MAVAAAALVYVLIGAGASDRGAPAPEAAAVAVPGGPIAQVKVPETLSAQAQMGKTFFEALCAPCHGLNAAGQQDVAPPLIHRFYVPSHHGDAAFASAARNGVRAHHWNFGDMPPIPEKLTDAEIASIVLYIREMQRENGIY